MGILEELWYGNLTPWEKGFKNCSEYSELLRLVIRHINELRERLNDEEKEIFETECCKRRQDKVYQFYDAGSFAVFTVLLISLRQPWQSCVVLLRQA